MKHLICYLLALMLLIGSLSACSSTPPEQTEPTEPTILTEDPTHPPDNIQYDSPEQEAVVKTALAFLNRGSRIQYDDTRLYKGTSPVIYRWQHSVKSPEDYSAQFYGYTNCAAFTHDVYLEALDFDIGAHTTASLISKGASQRVFYYEPNRKETAEEMAAVETSFRSELKRGDIIVIRYNGNSNGHAMLYVGDGILPNGGDIIHSSGSNYEYSGYTEIFESSGSVRTMSVFSLFSPGSSLNVFTKTERFAIIRPLNAYEGGVPEKTQNRIKNLQGIVAEKLCSHTYAMTVNPGDTMTFTFSVQNKNPYPVALTVTDAVPANTTYLSGADAVEDRHLSWKLTVPANSAGKVSYSVKVNEDAPYGTAIYSDAGTVGGVDTDCPKVYIAKTFSAAQQTAIQNAVKALADSPSRGVDRIDAIYTQAVGNTTGLPADFETLLSGIFRPFGLPIYRLNDNGAYLDMVVPGMFGGRYVGNRYLADDYHRLEAIRTRLPYSRDLIAGDIIVTADTDIFGETQYQIFLFDGVNVQNVMTGRSMKSEIILASLLGYERFAILRPSMTAEFP